MSEPAGAADAWLGHVDGNRVVSRPSPPVVWPEVLWLLLEHGSGADYYIGPPGAGEFDLEDCVRLEVSGLDKGNEREVIQRLLEKVQQARDGQSSLPAVAGVVGFRSKVLMVRDVEGSDDVG